MKDINESQLSFDFNLVQATQIDSTDRSSTFSNKVVHLFPHIQAKQQEKNAPLYQKIFDSIKHIG